MSKDHRPPADIGAAGAARREFLRDFGTLPSVVGLGVDPTDTGFVLRVDLAEPDPAIPVVVRGVPVVTRVVGRFVDLAPISPDQEMEHTRHLARGENHWITCPLCDDETDE